MHAVDGMKRCSKCKETKPVAEFHRNSARPDGYYLHCKACARVVTKAHRERKRSANDYRHVDMKQCGVCRETYPASDFYKSAGSPDNLAFSCKACDRLRKYDMLPADYWRMLEMQGRVCAICRQPCARRGDGVLAVDHDHVTGFVRGLLCESCNMGLGKFRDSAEFMLRAVAYLRGDLVEPGEVGACQETA